MKPRSVKILKRPSGALLACTLVLVAWVTIGFVIFSPRVSCNDCAVKYVQAQSLARHGFRSMALVYPGQMIDPDRYLIPFRPPFTLNAPDGLHTIWPPAVILAQTPFILAGGFGALVALSIISGMVVLVMSMRLARSPDDWVLPVALAFGTCLWYYAVQAWEHAPAVALLMCGLWLATTMRPRAVLLAALLVGGGVVLRDELMLLVPVLLLVVWVTRRSVRALFVACAGVAIVVLAAFLLDFVGYGRPPGAHLMHAVGALRVVFHNAFPSLPLTAVPAMSFDQRFGTVVQYWLTSLVSRTTVFLYLGGVLIAAAMMRWRRSSTGVLILTLIMLAWTGRELWFRIPEPRSIPSLFPLSPFLVFALFPAPGLTADMRRTRWLFLAGSVICVLAAIVLTDTAGGKSFGPRMLLGLMPLLSIGAWTGIQGYLRAGHSNPLDRIVGWAGVALIVVSIGMNVCALRAYAGRIAADRETLEAVERSPIRFVVVDDPYTAQMLMPLYFQRMFFVASGPEAASRASGALGRAGVTMALLVSRNEQPAISLEPYRLVSSERIGRMTVQQWIR